MSSIWERFIDSIRDDAGQLAKEELKLLIRDAVSDSDRFLQEQGRKMERYLTQLASDEITKEQFEGYMEDLRILTQMQARKMKVAAKARAQRLAQGIVDLVIDGLLVLV